MTVNRSEIDKAEVFKNRCLYDVFAELVLCGFELDRHLVTNGRRHADNGFKLPLCADVIRAAANFRQIFRDRADILGNRLIVVIENNDQIGAGFAGVVQSLIGKAARHGAVTDDSDCIMVAVTGNAHCFCHAECRRDRSAAVTGNERIMLGFRRLRESGKTAFLPQRFERTGASGQDFMHIGLMPDIPDNPCRASVSSTTPRFEAR